MRALDTTTKKYYQVRSIDFKEGYVVLESSERGGFKHQKLGMIKLILEAEDPRFTEERKKFSNLGYKIHRLEKSGYRVKPLGKNIKATKGKEVYSGSISSVYKSVFGY